MMRMGKPDLGEIVRKTAMDYTGNPDIAMSIADKVINDFLELYNLPIVEIIGADHKVHYTRPFGHPDVLEAIRTQGVNIRIKGMQQITDKPIGFDINGNLLIFDSADEWNEWMVNYCVQHAYTAYGFMKPKECHDRLQKLEKAITGIQKITETTGI